MICPGIWKAQKLIPRLLVNSQALNELGESKIAGELLPFPKQRACSQARYRKITFHSEISETMLEKYTAPRFLDSS